MTLSSYVFVSSLCRFFARLQNKVVHKVIFRYEAKLFLFVVARDDFADDVAPVICNVEISAFRDRLTDSSQLFQLIHCDVFVVFRCIIKKTVRLLIVRWVAKEGKYEILLTVIESSAYDG